MLRERRASGTLELLLTKPLSKGELLAGYALGFGVAAVVRVAAASALTIGPLGLDVHGSAVVLAVVAVVDPLLGTALGLYLSAYANSEFQAVQFLPAFVLPQLLLSRTLRAGRPDGDGPALVIRCTTAVLRGRRCHPGRNLVRLERVAGRRCSSGGCLCSSRSRFGCSDPAPSHTLSPRTGFPKAVSGF